MSPALTTMPPATKAEVLRRVLAMKHPKLELGTLAAHFQITIHELHALLQHHGYPDRGAMAKHVHQLDDQAQHNQSASHTAGTEDQVAASEEGDTSSTLGQLTLVKLTRLLTDPDNPRDELRDIDDLAASIKEAGLLQPILARTEGQRLIVVAGHRRLAAVRLLRWDTVPTIIRPSMKSAVVVAAMLIENNQRVDLDPIEEARGMLRLKNARGCSDNELAAIIGRNQVFVSSRLALLSLTAEQQAEVRAGNMKLTEATHLGRLNSGKVRKTGLDMNWHLGPKHTLANQAKARCQRMAHPRGRTVGGMACGACWEHVIRADERVHLVEHSHRTGSCATCGALVTAPQDA